MTVTELLKRIEHFRDEIGCDGKSSGSHSYPSRVEFWIENKDIDLELDLVDIVPQTHMGCGCWNGLTFVLRAKKEN